MMSLWLIIIFLAIVIGVVCIGIILHEFWEIFRNASIIDKIFMSTLTFLFLVALFCGSFFIKAISDEWDQSPILAIPLLYVLFTYNVKYILSIETDSKTDPRCMIKHYFYLFRIFGMAYVIVILGYVGLSNKFIFNMSEIDLALVFIICTFVVFVICYFISYGFIVFVFSKGKCICKSRKNLSKMIKKSDKNHSDN